MYDIIGDIHGYARELRALLTRLDYRQADGAYAHPTRKALFVGDFIDRGPEIGEVLDIVRRMVDAGSASAVMGNHEFNALAFATPNNEVSGEFLRPHNEKNVRQHKQTLEQLSTAELSDALSWFRTLPMWLEADELRVVHACWDEPSQAHLQQALTEHDGVSASFLHAATDWQNDTPTFHAVENVLKGKEIDLPSGVTYHDKDGHPRKKMRIRWFASPAGQTYRDYALSSDDGFPDLPLPPDLERRITPYPDNSKPVFFGHYWLRAERPAPLERNIACLDYSVAKGGQLCAYRFQGETELSPDHFVCIDSRVT